MWVEELGRELVGRQLDIWNGTSGLPPAKEESYRQLWRQQAAAQANRALIPSSDPTGLQWDQQQLRGALGLGNDQGGDQGKAAAPRRSTLVRPVGQMKPRGGGCGCHGK